MSSSASTLPGLGEPAASPAIGRWVAWLAGTSGAFLLVYLATSVKGLSAMSHDYADYPFGTDVPTYAFSGGSPRFHMLVTVAIRCYQWLLQVLHIPLGPLAIKIPYAVFGAAYVAAVTAAFGIWLRRLDLRVVLYGAACGLALMNWYYAVSPESYMLSGLLYAVYLCAVLYMVRNGVTPRRGAAAAVLFFLVLMNDLSGGLLLLVPAVYWGWDLVREPVLRRIVAHHAVAIAACIMLQSAVFQLHNPDIDFLDSYVWLFDKYSPLSIMLPVEEPESIVGMWDPFAAYFLHSLAAPSAELTSAPWVAFPDYHGFFDPSPLAYLRNLPGVIFAGAYLWLLSFIRPSRIGRLGLGLLAFVFARFLLAAVFNPVETIIYSSVATVAWLLVLFSCLEKSGSRHQTTVAALFCVSLLFANARFFS